MKRLIALFIVVIMAVPTVLAQSWLKNRTVGAVEFEIGVGLATAANKISNFGENKQGVDANVEVRYNFAKVPVDLGLYFSLCSQYRVAQIAGGISKRTFDSQNLLITSDYNLFQGRIASLFMGAGAGVAWSGRMADDSRYGFHFCAMPRVGVEIANSLRITVAYKFYERANNHLLLSVGIAFGGGKR